MAGTAKDEKRTCDGCGKYEAEEEHTCPFKEDVNNDSTTFCNCCANCRHECAMDI